MDKIRNIDVTQNRSELLAAIATPRVKQPVVGILKKANMTDSVCDVEDFSFDDTHDLCSSPSRLMDTITSAERRRSRGKRSRSGGHRDGPVLENIASPRKDPHFAAHKKLRRSRSIGVAFQGVDNTMSDSEDVDLVRQQRAYSLTDKSEAQRPRESRRNDVGLSSPRVRTGSEAHLPGDQLHNFAQKTSLKPEKCFVCLKRIKFGKVSLKCAGCRMTVHTECSGRMPPLCARSQSPDVCGTPRVDVGGLGRSPSKRTYFASPRLR
jgi:Rac GTPase-activating protein 1